MEQITIYPDERLFKKIEERAKKEKRSLNNLVLFVLEQEFLK